jgi:hypothetical protein
MRQPRWLGFLLLAILATSPLEGQSWLTDEPGRIPKRDDSGLRVEDFTDVAVSITELSREAKDVGLSRVQIESVVKPLLRKGRLQPVEYRETEGRKRDGAFLQVDVTVVGQVCEVSLRFRRIVVYTVGFRRYYTFGATTWRSEETEIVDGVAPVLASLERQMRRFVREYFEAN